MLKQLNELLQAKWQIDKEKSEKYHIFKTLRSFIIWLYLSTGVITALVDISRNIEIYQAEYESFYLFIYGVFITYFWLPYYIATQIILG